jgi:hypothetical protein
VPTPQLSDEDFDALRERVLANSSSAIATDKAIAAIAEREQRILSMCGTETPPAKTSAPSRKRRW